MNDTDCGDCLKWCVGITLPALILVVLAASPGSATADSDSQQYSLWPSKGLYAVRGKARRLDEGGIGFTRMSIEPGVGAVLSTGPLLLRADEYGFVRVAVSGMSERYRLYLLWRRNGVKDDRMLALPLMQDSDGNAIAWLGAHHGWHGTLSELAIGLEGPPGLIEPPVVIERVQLEPATWSNLFDTLAAPWRIVEPWTIRSINFVRYADSGFPGPTLQVLVVLLFVLAILSVVVAGRRRHLVIVLAIAVAWLVLDLRWQSELLYRVADTREQFSGKSETSKFAELPAGPLYRFSEWSKQYLAPGTQRIFLYAETPFQDYRLAYFLLPNRVIGEHPPFRKTRSGDYVVVYGKTDLVWDPETRTLRYRNSRRPAERLFGAVGHALYRVR